MPNLFPDMSREQFKDSENFIFAAPIMVEHWVRIDSVCRTNDRTPNGVHWVKYHEGDGKSFIMLMRRPEHTDDDMKEAAAYLRLFENRTEIIYALPYEATPPSQAVLLERTAGANPRYCKMISLPADDEEAATDY